MLQMEDNRIAVLPENGLPVGVFTTIPKVDIAGIEVLVGPGAALYGPDASNGVVTLLSKDPKQYPGTILELSVGGNSFSSFGDEAPGIVSFRNLQGRHAGVLMNGRLGYKVTGEIIDAYDWQNTNVYAPAVAGGAPSPEIGIDWNTDYLRGGGALVWYFDGGARLEYQGGASKSNGVGITSVGRNQLSDWGYWNQQVRFTSDQFFAQVYATRSLSGQTFALNGFSTNRRSPRFAGQSDDSVRLASSFPMVGELQLRGPQMFGGYFNAPARTAEVMTADGWLRTGDLAVRRRDGLWAIRGRRKEMYISGGENVFPGEVEAALLNCGGVSAACVVGVPDARWGEVGCAVIVRETAPVGPDSKALLADARARLAGYKVPRHVVFVDQMPTLGSGKIDRRAVLALASAEMAAVVAEPGE